MDSTDLTNHYNFRRLRFGLYIYESFVPASPGRNLGDVPLVLPSKSFTSILSYNFAISQKSRQWGMGLLPGTSP